jgi:hypothetical protein
MAETASSIARIIGFDVNDKLIRNLRPQSETLELLREEFSKMLADGAFSVDSFQETQSQVQVPGFPGKVTSKVAILNRCKLNMDQIVATESSTVGYALERKYTISDNHREMCRFKGRNEDAYIKVVGALQRHLTEIQQKLDSTQSSKQRFTFHITFTIY